MNDGHEYVTVIASRGTKWNPPGHPAISWSV
jgi:hypothetical protein